VSLIPLFTTALLVFCGLTLSVLRTVVTSEEVHVQYGLWGPRIPIEAIRSCKVVPYDVLKYGGWGLKYRNGVWAYTMHGHPDVVELEWDERGKTKHAVVSSDDPAMLARKIQQSRGVRIALGESVEDEQIAAEEEEALEEEEASASRNRV
jgi:hypothetical protein